MTKDTMTAADASDAILAPPPINGSFRRGLSLSRRISATFFEKNIEPTYQKRNS